MDGVEGTSRNNNRLCGVACACQVRKHLVESQVDVTSNVFTQHPTGSRLLKYSEYLRPEVTVIIRALSLPGHTERLARVSAGNKVNSSIVLRVESFHVAIDRHGWEVLGEHAPRPWVDLTECHGFDAAHPLSRKSEATNPREQIQMSNKALLTNDYRVGVIGEVGA